VTAGHGDDGPARHQLLLGQGIAFMHESLYAAVGKRLPYVLNMGCRAITKASLNVHAGHDDYHCVDDTGFIQVMAKNATEAADLNLIGRKHRRAGADAGHHRPGRLPHHAPDRVLRAARARAGGRVPGQARRHDRLRRPRRSRCSTAPKRRRVPAIWDVDLPLLSGSVQNQDAYMQAVAGQRPYFFDHVEALADGPAWRNTPAHRAGYQRVMGFKTEDADYLILGMGSMIVQAEAVADYLRETRKLKVGVVNLTMFRPVPRRPAGPVLRGKKGVAVLERTDQPLAEDLPLMREVRATLMKCVENGMAAAQGQKGALSRLRGLCRAPQRHAAPVFGLLRPGQPRPATRGADRRGREHAARGRAAQVLLPVDRLPRAIRNPKDEVHQQDIADKPTRIRELACAARENPNLMPKGAITVRMHSVGGWGAITTGKNLAMTLFELLGWDIKANPKYGSEKKGQPTTYYLSAAPEPIRINCEYVYVDVVLSPDPACSATATRSRA
jgi:pyruvate-ferredoxin/flavodoxin oxidoreductase